MDRSMPKHGALIGFGVLFVGCLVAISVAKETVIGIDLGTSYSCVGVYKNDRVQIIANDHGNRVTPSWVAFTDGQVLIGEDAKNQACANSQTAIFDVKRLIGRRFDDPEVQKDIKLLPYNIVNKDDKPYFEVRTNDGKTKVFSPEEISAMILTKMKETAEAFLGTKIKDAVITIPIYFTANQKHATKHAGAIAGLNVALYFDPVAVAIAYGLDKKDGETNILLFELGGGTFYVTIMSVDYTNFRVLGIGEDAHLGGADFDQNVVKYFIDLFMDKYGKDIRKDNCALGKLTRETERARQVLSDQTSVQVEIKSLYEGLDFSETLTHVKFEELNKDLFNKIMELVQTTVVGSRLQKSQIDEIILVRGSTRIPKIQQLLKAYFDGKEPKKEMDPDEVIAYGATVYGGNLTGANGGKNNGGHDELQIF